MSAGRVRQGGVFVEIGADARKFFATLDKINKQVGKVGASMAGLGARMAGFGAALGAPIALATAQFASFDDAIRATAAVSGATGDALQSLNEKARELGATTSFTAVQVANLMTELGRAGFKPDEIEAMTGAVLDLARATGTDATLSAGIMAATLRQFGLGATDAARAADVLTKAANSTFNTVEGLGESLKYAGPVAKSLGMSLEDTTAILGVLGNVGIQGSEAGTALRRLSVIAAGSGDELKKIFGITNTDAAGNLKPLVDILDEINQVTANMPVAERTAKMAEAFGLLGITSANVLSAAAGGVRGLAKSLRGAAGTAAAAAKEMDAGLGGSIRILLSAVEGTALAIGDALAPGFQKLAAIATSLAGGFTKIIAANQEAINSIAKGVAIFGGAGVALIGLGSALQLVSFGFGGLLKAATVVIGPIVAVISTVAGLAASFVSAIAGVLAYSTASVTSAVASGAAWAAANAPLLILIGLLGAAGAIAIQAMGGFQGMAAALSGGLSTAASDAAVVFGDLATTAKTTFGGIYEAIAGGDLAGAMDILWAGLQAGWLRGVEALMSYVDPWVAFLQNTFTYMGTGIATTWESMWSGLVQGANTIGAVVMGVVDNLVNGVMAAFDAMVAAVRKSWNWVQSFIVKGYDLAKENQKVDSEMSARAREREAKRPGVTGRVAQADKENKQTARETQSRIDDMNQSAADTAQGRYDENDRRANERRQQTQSAEANVAAKSKGARNRRVYGEQFAELLKNIEAASSIGQLQDLYGEFDALSQNGRLTSVQAATIEAALEDAQERISKAGSGMGASGNSSVNQESLNKAAADASASQSEVAGSFSAQAIAGMGFGQSLAQKQLDALKQIEQNTRPGDDGLVAA